MHVLAVPRLVRIAAFGLGSALLAVSLSSQSQEEQTRNELPGCCTGDNESEGRPPSSKPDASSAEVLTLPLRFALSPTEDPDPELDAWLQTQIEQTNRIFAAAGLAFRKVALDTLPPGHEHMRTRRDRHRLVRHLRPHVINCFLVQYLEDVDEPGRERQGVHWRAPRPKGNHYVILSRRAGPDVLAHELGHFFGNRAHSHVPGNIMSYTRGPDLPHLDDAQVAKIQAFARRFVRRGELRPVPKPSQH